MFLMDTRNGESERLLVDAAADRMPDGGHVLIGGLGVGFSLAAAVTHQRVQKITVVEREPAVIEWGHGPLAHLHGNALDDARVSCVEADVAEYLRIAEVRFDAVCMDVDNGPEWAVSEGNRCLYDDTGLAMVGRRLTPGGMLAVWSASAAPAFATRLRTRFDDVEVLIVPVPRGEPDTVFLARKQYGCTV
jgi:spermidine synthase